MKSTHSPFPTYKLRKQTPCNKFQNDYRDEIKELISGTEYLDQILNSKYKKPKSDTRNENSPRNFNSMTPEAKRKLMFQRPVTLIKRQTKYYSNHAKTPKKSAKKEEKPNLFYSTEKKEQQNVKISPKNQIDQIETDMPLYKPPNFNTDIQTTPQKKNKSAQHILEQEKQEEFDSFSLDADDLIDNSNSNLKFKLNKLNKEIESKKNESDLKEKKNKKITQNNFQFSDQENQKEYDSYSFEADELIGNLNQKIECKTFENKRISQNSIQSSEKENQKESDSNSFEANELIENSNFINNNNLNQENENKKTEKKEKKNKGFNYFQASFDQGESDDGDDEISDPQTKLIDDEISDPQTKLIDDETSDPQTELIDDEIISISEISVHTKNERRISLSHKKALIMVSTDAIEAEVNFTSDSSSSDFEFQSQFFVQEKVVKPEIVKNKNIQNCGKFISSEAIESFSDE